VVTRRFRRSDDHLRGARTNDGQKLFGAHLQDEDVCVGTRVDQDSETELYRGNQMPTSDTEFSELVELLAERGGALESRKSVSTSDEVQAHLRDLGYVE
jgi:hypothetical protein